MFIEFPSFLLLSVNQHLIHITGGYLTPVPNFIMRTRLYSIQGNDHAKVPSILRITITIFCLIWLFLCSPNPFRWPRLVFLQAFTIILCLGVSDLSLLPWFFVDTRKEDTLRYLAFIRLPCSYVDWLVNRADKNTWFDSAQADQKYIQNLQLQNVKKVVQI